MTDFLLLPRYVLAEDMTPAELINALVRQCFDDPRSVHDATYGKGKFLEATCSSIWA